MVQFCVFPEKNLRNPSLLPPKKMFLRSAPMDAEIFLKFVIFWKYAILVISTLYYITFHKHEKENFT